MIGVPGTAHRLFGALREAGISVILISQGSSEHSICCAIPAGPGGARRAGACARAFDSELRAGTDPERRGRTRPAASSPSSATAWPARPAWPPRCSPRSARRASTCARSRRARPSATSPWSSTDAARRKRAARGASGLLPVAADALDRRDRPGHGGPACCSTSSRSQARAPARASSTSTCACAASLTRRRMLLADAAIELARWREQLERRAASRATSSAFAQHVHADTCRTP